MNRRRPSRETPLGPGAKKNGCFRRLIKPFLLENDPEKFSSNLSQQSESSETTPRVKLVLVTREPLLYLEFNKPNKQNVSEINLRKKFNFSQCQNNC